MQIKVKNITEARKMDTQSILLEAQKSLAEYLEIQLSYEQGELSYETTHHYHEEIIKKSPYEDIFDFYHDYQRYRAGLPIYIDIVKGGNE